MTPEQINRARWVQNSPTTMILKCRAKDGGAVLATIEKQHYFSWRWGLSLTLLPYQERSLYAAQRAVRKALQEKAI